MQEQAYAAYAALATAIQEGLALAKERDGKVCAKTFGRGDCQCPLGWAAEKAIGYCAIYNPIRILEKEKGIPTSVSEDFMMTFDDPNRFPDSAWYNLALEIRQNYGLPLP